LAVIVALGTSAAAVPMTETSQAYAPDRLGGVDRVATAVAISQRGFADAQAATVVVARSDQFADALGGGALAIYGHGPLLLTPTDTLDPRTRDEIRRALHPNGKVYLLGGETALSAGVEAAVRAEGFTTTRLAGADRYETAVAIAREMHSPGKVLLATGRNFPDGLVASAAAGQIGAAVLLTEDNRMPAATSAYLSATQASQVWAVGDQAAAAAPSASAIRGVDRYETAVMVANTFWGTREQPGQIGVATGENFPDALAGAALVVVPDGGPLLLTRRTELPQSARRYIIDHCSPIKGAWVYGQEDVVSQEAWSDVSEALSACGP
jgi:putative cell wall-binding protein